MLQVENDLQGVLDAAEVGGRERAEGGANPLGVEGSDLFA